MQLSRIQFIYFRLLGVQSEKRILMSLFSLLTYHMHSLFLNYLSNKTQILAEISFAETGILHNIIYIYN